MSRKYWIILGVLIGLIVVGSAAAGFGYLQFRKQRTAGYLAAANKAFEAQDWSAAKQNYRRYLSKDRLNIEILRKYAHAASQITDDRFLALGDVSKAYYQIADADPDDAESLRTLMELQETRGNWSDLEYYSSYFLDVRPDDPMLLYYQAVAWDQLDRVDLAETAYRELIKSGELYRPDVYLRLALLMQERGLTTQARTLLNDAVTAQPENGNLLAQRAAYLLGNTEIELARPDIARSLELAPGDALALINATRLAMSDRDWPKAIEYGKAVLAVDPGETDAILMLADAYQNEADLDAAIAMVESLDPFLRADHPELYMTEGELLLRKGDMDAVRASIAEYRRVYPQHIIGLDYLDARVLLAEGNAVTAAEKLTAIIQSRPNFKQAHLYLIAAKLQLQDRAGAKNELDAYLSNYPNDAQATALFQREFGGEDSLRLALARGEALLAQPDSDVEALLVTATEVYNKSASGGSKDENADFMKRLAEAAIERAPTDSRAYTVLAEVLVNTGDLEGAERTIESANAQGVDPDTMRLARAVIAAAQKDEATALSLFEAELAAAPMTADDIVRWTGFFVHRVSLDAGMRAYELAIASAEDDLKLLLTLEQLDVLIGARDTDRAVELLAKLESRENLATNDTAALLDRKRAIIRTLIASGDAEKLDVAQNFIGELLQFDPTDVDSQLLEADVLLARKPADTDGAERIVAAVLARDPLDSAALLTGARVAEAAGKYADALGFVEKALASNRGAAADYFLLARMQLRSNRESEAIQSLEETLRLEPQNTSAKSMLVETLRATGRLARAETLLNELDAQAGDSEQVQAMAKTLRARINLDKGVDLPAAEADLRAQLEAKPDDIGVATDLARAMAKQGRVDDATAFFTKFVEEHNDDPESWVALARYYLVPPAGPNLDEARSALLSADLAGKREYLPALGLLIDVAVQSNHLAQALSVCDRYLAIQPNSAAVLHQKARLLLSRKEYAPALEALNKSIELEPRPEKRETRGDLHLALDRFEEAITDYQEFGRLTGTLTPRVQLALADAYAGSGNLARAVEYFREANARLGANDPARNDERFRRLQAQLENYEPSE